MMIDLYSFYKLDLSVRGSFELPSYPNGDYHSYFEDYLRKLSVFRFTCTDTEVCPEEVLIKREEAVDLVLPFDCYFNSCAISDDSLAVMDWPNDNPAGKALHAQLMSHPIAKDNKAWFSWNVKVSVLKLRKGCIQTEVIKGASESLVANQKLEKM